MDLSLDVFIDHVSNYKISAIVNHGNIFVTKHFEVGGLRLEALVSLLSPNSIHYISSTSCLNLCFDNNNFKYSYIAYGILAIIFIEVK